nr:DNA helicase [Tanacetum cinerariifolium]
MSAPEIVFGGKTIILGGDFRQTLPVKKGAAKEELIYASIANSYLWPHFKVYMLRENMRLLRSDRSDEQQKSLYIKDVTIIHVPLHKPPDRLTFRSIIIGVPTFSCNSWGGNPGN